MCGTDERDSEIGSERRVCEIQFDEVLKADNEHIHGAYRLPSLEWVRFTFLKADQPRLVYELSMPLNASRSSACSLRYVVPQSFTLDRAFVRRAIADFTKEKRWRR